VEWEEGDILIFQNLTAEGGPNPISRHEKLADIFPYDPLLENQPHEYRVWLIAFRIAIA
jgi:hypothetical protein